MNKVILALSFAMFVLASCGDPKPKPADEPKALEVTKPADLADMMLAEAKRLRSEPPQNEETRAVLREVIKHAKALQQDESIGRDVSFELYALGERASAKLEDIEQGIYKTPSRMAEAIAERLEYWAGKQHLRDE